MVYNNHVIQISQIVTYIGAPGVYEYIYRGSCRPNPQFRAGRYIIPLFDLSRVGAPPVALSVSHVRKGALSFNMETAVPFIVWFTSAWTSIRK